MIEELGKWLLLALLCFVGGVIAFAVVSAAVCTGGVITVLMYRLGLMVLATLGWA